MSAVSVQQAMALPTRIFARLDFDSAPGCWLWTGPAQQGYGRCHTRGFSGMVHRQVYQRVVGVAPADGLHLHHICKNKLCANPAHLVAVTAHDHEDSAPTIQRTKTHCKRGHPYDEVNTYVTKAGYRQCRECNRITGRAYAARLRARKAGLVEVEWEGER